MGWYRRQRRPELVVVVVVVLGAGVRCLRGCGLVPCGARLPATAGCPLRPGNARGCWDDRTGIVRTSTGRCFVGRGGQ